MKLFNTWWIISSFKIQFSNHILGQAAKKDDGKPEFCRVLADWIETWCNERVPSFEQFTLSLSTAKALIQTSRCQASLIVDLLDDGYDFILTARFQSDPLESRFEQSRQLSGGHFLVGLKDAKCSKNILKIKCLLEEDIDIDEEIKISCPGEMEIMKLKTHIDSLGISLDTLMLSPDSREVVVHITVYTAKKYLKKIKSSSCCKMLITGSIDTENPDHQYLIILNRGGLIIPSPNLVNYVCDAFAVLSATENILINQSKLTSRNAAKEALSYLTRCCNFTCENHKVDGQKFVISTIVNVLFNKKLKISTASVRKDNVASFKKLKRETIA